MGSYATASVMGKRRLSCKKTIFGIFLRPLRNLDVLCVLLPHSSQAKPISGIFCDFCVVFAPFAFGSRTRTRIRTRSKALFIV